MLARSVRLDVPEGDAAEGLGELQAAHPDVQIGSYPFFENKRLGTYIVLRSVDEAKLAAAENALWEFIAEEGFELPPATAEPAFVDKANHWGRTSARAGASSSIARLMEGYQGARNLIGVRARRKATRHERHRFRRPTAIADERHQPFLELACGESVAEKVHHAGVAPIASDTAIGSLDSHRALLRALERSDDRS